MTCTWKNEQRCSMQQKYQLCKFRQFVNSFALKHTQAYDRETVKQRVCWPCQAEGSGLRSQCALASTAQGRASLAYWRPQPPKLHPAPPRHPSESKAGSPPCLSLQCYHVLSCKTWPCYMLSHTSSTCGNSSSKSWFFATSTVGPLELKHRPRKDLAG